MLYLYKVGDGVNLYNYICKNCGTEIIGDENTKIRYCVHCNNLQIEKNKLDEEINYKKIIPFTTTKLEAIKRYKNNLKYRWLIPSVFKKYIYEIKGIYVPCYIYNFDSIGEVELECENINKWVSQGYKYTKIDKCKVIRGASMSLENIPISTSKNIQDDIINFIEPYDYSKLKEFDDSDIKDFLLAKQNILEEEINKKSIDKAKIAFIEVLKKDLKNYNKILETCNSINFNNSKKTLILLPMWILNIKYKNKIYTFAMNGQTGKLFENFPLNKNKIIYIWLILFFIIFIISLILQVIL